MTKFIAGPPSILPAKVKTVLDRNMSPDEIMYFCLVGRHDQTLVAFESRALIIKTGMMAGITFGSKATSFDYSDISGIEVESGMTRAFIQIVTSGFEQSRRVKTNAKDMHDRPNELPNCLPILKSDLAVYRPFLDELRGFVSTAKAIPPESKSGNSGLVDQLSHLGNLYADGIISDVEFAQAKRKLLD